MVLISFLALSSLCAAATFDYIIVGGGTAGLVLANRLSEDSDVTVALIDPGPDQRSNALVRDSSPSVALYRSKLSNWDYHTLPQSNASGRVLEIHSGKGLGGSSLVNAMAYVRGDKAQFDAWEEFGNPGWNWKSLLPYYKKHEKMFSPTHWQIELGATIIGNNHGSNGNVHVGFGMTSQNASFFERIQQTWSKLGQVLNQDVNSGNTTGSSICPQTIDPDMKQRWDAATAYLWPIENRPNLKLVNGTATKVLWKNEKSYQSDKYAEADGIAYITPSKQVQKIRASREVILSAGTFRTPVILERSGVGNPNLLKKWNIDCVVDLPGVGENLVDQPNTSFMFKAKSDIHGCNPYVSFETAADIFGSKLERLARETESNLGRWAKEVAVLNPSGPGAAAIERKFRIQHDLIFKKGVTISEIFTSAYHGVVVSTAATLLPFSRGSIHMSPDNEDPTVPDLPVIDTKFLSVDFDLECQVAAGRSAARLSTTSPLSDLATTPLLPPDDDSPSPPYLDAGHADWQKWTADAIGSNWHSMGTAAMMSKELGGVVDPELRVYGTKGLRIVDASILPIQFSGHPMATVYAVSERAAEIIKGNYKVPMFGDRTEYLELR